jgi:1,4-alpha-glucan branching enzyme
MIDDASVAAICRGEHGDPFAILGPHLGAEGRQWVRCFLPNARRVGVLDDAGKPLFELTRREGTDFFEGRAARRRKADAGPFRYRLLVDWEGFLHEVEDPYRFPPVLGELDVWLLAEGSHRRPFERLGAHLRAIDGVEGTAFAVWAPDAARVSVVGDFNHWDGRRHPMRLRRECGVWEIFLPGVGAGACYKYEIRGAGGALLPLKADPYGFAAEMRPSTASVVAPLPPPVPHRDQLPAGERLGTAVSIYEVHLGSWRRRADGTFLSWAELAGQLVPYAAGLGFTHLELLPVSEHPFDGSWGYQPLGLYAPSARFGPPEGFRDFVAACHRAGLGVIVDWVPAHFPSDEHGLGRFDGTPLYEHADPREGMHMDWGTLIYNFGRREVMNYLIGNALFWIERYGVDGLRVDAVASMLYRDYSRKPGEWVPNIHGGRENLEAMAFLRRMNQVLGEECPAAATFAEESTAFPAVSRPPSMGGLGFHYKWNLGWMHDVLSYMQQDPVHRKHHHSQLSFGLIYAFTENFLLPLSHDEVVHGKGSLLGKMSGDDWQKFANLRALFGFMWAHPGKKLLFMGGEFGQRAEWAHDRALDWAQLDYGPHAGVQRLVADLNAFYRATPALFEIDFAPEGFEWIVVDDAANSVLAFARRGHDRSRLVLCVCNFTPVVRHGYRVGVPMPGEYRERLNTDSHHYGGSNVGTPLGAATAEPVPAHGRPQSVLLTLPPLSVLYFECAGG